jgi:hypothetical protein
LKGKLIYYDGVIAFELGPEKELFQGFFKLKDVASSPDWGKGIVMCE